MIDLMLRFETEAEAANLLAAYRLDGAWIAASHGHALDVVGPVVVVPAVADPATGKFTAPPVMDERFHVNLRLLDGEVPASLEAFTVHPAQPARVWA